MPTRSKRPCNFHGCPALTTSRFCVPHTKALQAAYDERRGTSTARGYDARWARVRAMKLGRDPLCESCRDHDRPAVLVHHRDRDPRNNRMDNLTSLCMECHNAEHALERWVSQKK